MTKFIIGRKSGMTQLFDDNGNDSGNRYKLRAYVRAPEQDGRD